MVGHIKLTVPVSRLRSEPWTLLLEKISIVLGKGDSFALLNGGVRSPKFIWAPCAQLYSLAETPHPPPRIWSHIRGRLGKPRQTISICDPPDHSSTVCYGDRLASWDVPSVVPLYRIRN